MSALLSLLLLAAPVDLVVHAKGFTHARGHAVAKLFFPGQNVRGKGHAQVRADIKDGEATLTFRGVAEGDVAVVVFHDENDNREIDHGPLGPKEPLGFSNGFELSLVSWPTFEKLKFALTAEHAEIEVKVK
jgi:uncharacterized protein (DUF2141 family)